MTINPDVLKAKAERLAAIQRGEIERPAPPPPVAELPRKPARDLSVLVSRHYDVEIFFDPAYVAEHGCDKSEIVKVHARSPVSALMTASYTPSQEWDAAKLLAVISAVVHKAF